MAESRPCFSRALCKTSATLLAVTERLCGQSLRVEIVYGANHAGLFRALILGCSLRTIPVDGRSLADSEDVRGELRHCARAMVSVLACKGVAR